jgi:hypothetical protein
MPLSRIDLRLASTRAIKQAARTLIEAREVQARTVFLCHSHLDLDLVRGLVALLTETRWKVYVDWTDTEMPNAPDRATAMRLQQKIAALDLFLFLATPNSMSSRWCPWEIGYATGIKPIERIIVCPTSEGSITSGSEYLQLYRRIDASDGGDLAVWQPGDHHKGVLVETL